MSAYAEYVKEGFIRAEDGEEFLNWNTSPLPNILLLQMWSACWPEEIRDTLLRLNVV